LREERLRLDLDFGFTSGSDVVEAGVTDCGVDLSEDLLVFCSTFVACVFASFCSVGVVSGDNFIFLEVGHQSLIWDLIDLSLRSTMYCSSS